MHALASTIELKASMERSFALCPAMQVFMRQENRDDAYIEETEKPGFNAPGIELSYYFLKTDWHAIEAQFSLRGHKLTCEVQTWLFSDGLGEKSQQFQLAQNSQLYRYVEAAPLDTLPAFTDHIRTIAVTQHVALLNSVGVTVSDKYKLKLREFGSKLLIL
ncbi:MAG: hypothetical protein Q7U16_12685 [Agitococcus sp.]|nr:hypothetical protein [Agitococcus sp.]